MFSTFSVSTQYLVSIYRSISSHLQPRPPEEGHGEAEVHQRICSRDHEGHSGGQVDIQVPEREEKREEQTSLKTYTIQVENTIGTTVSKGRILSELVFVRDTIGTTVQG